MAAVEPLETNCALQHVAFRRVVLAPAPAEVPEVVLTVAVPRVLVVLVPVQQTRAVYFQETDTEVGVAAVAAEVAFHIQFDHVVALVAHKEAREADSSLRGGENTGLHFCTQSLDSCASDGIPYFWK